MPRALMVTDRKPVPPASLPEYPRWYTTVLSLGPSAVSQEIQQCPALWSASAPQLYLGLRHGPAEDLRKVGAASRSCLVMQTVTS